MAALDEVLAAVEVMECPEGRGQQRFDPPPRGKPAQKSFFDQVYHVEGPRKLQHVIERENGWLNGWLNVGIFEAFLPRSFSMPVREKLVHEDPHGVDSSLRPAIARVAEIYTDQLLHLREGHRLQTHLVQSAVAFVCESCGSRAQLHWGEDMMLNPLLYEHHQILVALAEVAQLAMVDHGLH